MRVVFSIPLEEPIHFGLIIDWKEVLDLGVLVLHLLILLLAPIVRASEVVFLQQAAFETIALGLLLHRLIYKSMDTIRWISGVGFVGSLIMALLGVGCHLLLRVGASLLVVSAAAVRFGTAHFLSLLDVDFVLAVSVFAGREGALSVV